MTVPSKRPNFHPQPSFPYEHYQNLYISRPNFRKKDEFIVPLEVRGKGFVVKRGETARIVCVEGPQIVDLCIWNANNYKEHFWSDYTLNREGIFLTTFSRLWGNMPMFRPLMTIIENTVETEPTHPGADHHYCIGSHCNPSFWYWALKDKNHPNVTKFNCWANLLRGVEPFGLGQYDLHSNINLFQKTHFELDTGLRPVDPSDARKGDYVEFYAEMDVLMAVSLCPSGSGSAHWSAEEQDVKPIGIEIYETNIEPAEFDNVMGEQGFQFSLEL